MPHTTELAVEHAGVNARTLDVLRLIYEALEEAQEIFGYGMDNEDAPYRRVINSGGPGDSAAVDITVTTKDQQHRLKVDTYGSTGVDAPALLKEMANLAGVEAPVGNTLAVGVHDQHDLETEQSIAPIDKLLTACAGMIQKRTPHEHGVNPDLVIKEKLHAGVVPKP